MPVSTPTSAFSIYRLRQAAIDRLNLHAGRLSITDYRDIRMEIKQAKTPEQVKQALRDGCGEEIRL